MRRARGEVGEGIDDDNDDGGGGGDDDEPAGPAAAKAALGPSTAELATGERPRSAGLERAEANEASDEGGLEKIELESSSATLVLRCLAEPPSIAGGSTSAANSEGETTALEADLGLRPGNCAISLMLARSCCGVRGGVAAEPAERREASEPAPVERSDERAEANDSTESASEAWRVGVATVVEKDRVDAESSSGALLERAGRVGVAGEDGGTASQRLGLGERGRGRLAALAVPIRLAPDGESVVREGVADSAAEPVAAPARAGSIDGERAMTEADRRRLPTANSASPHCMVESRASLQRDTQDEL